MTEFVDSDDSQIGYEVTGLTAAAEEIIAARPEQLDHPGPPRRGARFTGHNRLPNGFEYEVTCVLTEADRPRAFAGVVLDDSGDPLRPSSRWRYQIDPLSGGGSRVQHRFAHGPGASYLRTAAAKTPNQAAAIIVARRDRLRSNVSTTLRAMKAAAESGRPPNQTLDSARDGLGHVENARAVLM